ncbi:MAG TPA: hypothetical protein VFB21_22520 [Chthonomonadaceae bacterium]|nr:hypothetical protein [Chthonomonadaceae bacterium]
MIPRRAAWLGFLLLALLIAYHLLALHRFGLATVGGITYPLLDDDVMISMHYGRNLAQGEGLVYNRGEAVEGFTNPLLTFVAAVLHLLPVPPPVIAWLLILLNLALSLGIALLLMRFWGDSPTEKIAGLIGAGFYVTLPHHAFFAYAGYEVYMQAALLLFVLRRIERMGLPEALALGLLPLTHGLGLVAWAVLVGALCLLPAESLHKRVLLAGLALAPALAYELFRLWYYGEPLPNTYWLKAGSGSLAGGVRYLLAWGGVVSPLALLGAYPLIARCERRVALMWLVLAAHALAVMALGGDIFPQYRFLFPCSALLAALAGRGVAQILACRPASSLRWQPGVLLAVTAAVAYAGLWKPFSSYRDSLPELEENRRWIIRHLALGLAIGRNTSPHATIAVFGLGYLGYYGGRYCIDMLGKTDRHIARVPPVPERPIGHNKTDFDYVLARSPDFIELDMEPPIDLEDTEGLREEQHDPYGYSADLALHPVFRRVYGPHPVRDVKGRPLSLYAKSRAASRSWRVAPAYFTGVSENSPHP